MADLDGETNRELIARGLAASIDDVRLFGAEAAHGHGENRPSALTRVRRWTVPGGWRAARGIWLSRLRPIFQTPKYGRPQPLAYVRAGLSLASPTEGFIAYRPMGEQFGFFAEASRLFGKALL